MKPICFGSGRSPSGQSRRMSGGSELRRYLAAVVAFATVFVSWGQRALTDIPNPDPDYQQSLLKPTEGFEVSLFAAEPMIAKPLAINFDSKGRLWVASSETYPQIVPGQLPSDKVYRLEDTDGDGEVDKSVAFAGGLLMPTAILPTPDGVYVANSTELLFYEDRDDDGVSDSKRVVLSGFGTEDTHHIIHTLRAGPAGRIYFNQSIYIHSYVETPYGLRELKAGGVWRFRLETMELDVFTRGLWNTWGHQWDQWGQSFLSDGAGFEGISYGFPGAAFARSSGYERIMPGLNPGQPKFSGLEVIAGGTFPESWQGRVIVCDFRGNRISSFKPVDSGSGFIAPQQEDLLTSTHGSFRPIDVQLGPDGALYVADWYNPIIQHGEVDFRDERRDREHGRIWRIAAEGSAPIKSPDLSKDSVEELLERLKSGDRWTLTQAKLELKSRGADAVIGLLKNWVKALDASDSNLDRWRLEALWVSLSLRQPDLELMDQLMASENFRARAAAIRAMEEHPDRIDGIWDRVEQAIDDEHPRVRMEALHVLRALGGSRAAQLAAKAYRDAMDEPYDFSLWTTFRELSSDWVPAVKRDPRFLGSDTKALLFAITCSDDASALEPLVSLWRSGSIEADAIVSALRLLAELGDSEIATDALKAVVERANAGLPGVATILEGLDLAQSKRSVSPAATAADVKELLSSNDTDGRIAAARLAGAWKVEGIESVLAAIVEDPSSDPSLSGAAVEGLVKLNSADARRMLEKLGGADQPYETRLRALAGYALAAPKSAVPMVAAALSDASPDNDATPLLQPYLSSFQLTKQLASGLDGVKIDSEVGIVLLRLFGSLSFEATQLEEAIRSAAGIEKINQALSAEQMEAFLEFVDALGDPTRGEIVYRREALLCQTCHAIGGAGGSLGPDLTSIGASAPMDYIVDSLLEPQKKIKEGYHVVSVTKKDGALLAGTLASEDANSITLRDMTDRRISVPKSEIASQTISPVSLMPPGLTASLRKDELADMTLFLSRIGREGDFKVAATPLVRTFRYLDDQGGSRAFADIVRHKPMEHVATDDPRFVWKPIYTLVDGSLPLDEIPFLRRAGRLNYHYARFDLDVKQAGSVKLRFNDSDTIRLWMGQAEIEGVADETVFDADVGLHTFTLAVSRYDRKNRQLSIEVVDDADSTAQVQIVNGQ